jgi:multicomponent Na+:H+ antiporter subunit G
MNDSILAVASLVLLALGTVALLIAAWGVLALPDALARQHAATKAGTLAAALITLGAMAAEVDTGWWVRLVVILVFLFATLPVSSHMLARAALREQDPDEHIDEIPLAGGERSPNAKHTDSV